MFDLWRGKDRKHKSYFHSDKKILGKLQMDFLNLSNSTRTTSLCNSYLSLSFSNNSHRLGRYKGKKKKLLHAFGWGVCVFPPVSTWADWFCSHKILEVDYNFLQTYYALRESLKSRTQFKLINQKRGSVTILGRTSQYFKLLKRKKKMPWKTGQFTEVAC